MKNISAILQQAPLAQLVQQQNFVGWVYRIDYDQACVMTNDLWKARALGVPHNCFLVATDLNPTAPQATAPEDQEVILLRVVGSAKLPLDDDLVKTKIDHYQAQQGATTTAGGKDYDPITLNQIQFGGLECRVLGTFYMKDDELCLGSDLESFATAARLQVYRPRRESLEQIVNYISPLQRQKAIDEAKALGIQGTIAPFQLGTVRYTSADRLHRGKAAELVPVCMQPSDLLARRTAVLGMTRTGKSNMVKQMVRVVKQVADAGRVPIGQLIYDLNGEYANANQQDKGSIADVFPQQTVRYRMLQTKGFEELQNNFYVQLNEGFGIIQRLLDDAKRVTTDYVRQFVNMSLDEPDRAEQSEHKRWERRVAAYQALLHKAGFLAPPGLKVKFDANVNVRRAVDAVLTQQGHTALSPVNGLSITEAVHWFEAARIANAAQQLPSSRPGSFWLDDTVQNLLDMIAQSSRTGNFISGYRLLTDAIKYHSPRRSSEVGAEVYQHLQAGKIVILDLSVGDPELRERISKQIASHVFNRSMEIFVGNQTPPNIVVYIEEAHNLIGKGLELTETWPRLAKEGAKYRIALVYATQEVTSIHPNILSNTENWFISHLNNEREMKELAQFYDFSDFSRSLLRAQDVGFTRVKTLSSPFVVPVQIDKFDPGVAQSMEEQAGEPPTLWGNGHVS